MPSAAAHPVLHHLALRFFATPLAAFMLWLTAHTTTAYFVLFFGAYLETLVGPGFFIPGELFLLAGSILAGFGVLNIWLVLIVLYGGAIMGDSSSYFIGRLVGRGIFKDGARFLSTKNYNRAHAFFEKHGAKAFFFARLVGPFGLIMPFLGGVTRVPYKKFIPYNLLGILVGVGEFIAAGYFFGNRYQLVLWLIERYALVVIGLGLFAFLLHQYLKSRKAKGTPDATV